MKIKKDCKIELCASKDASRHILTRPYLDKEKGMLVATDGRRLVALPVETGPEDISGPIDLAALAHVRKGAKKGSDCEFVAGDGKYVFSDGAQLPRPELGGTYSNYKQVIPSDEEHKFTVTFNAKWLYEMAQAIGTEAVTLRMKDADSHILVGHSSYPSAIGVLMPIRIA